MPNRQPPKCRKREVSVLTWLGIILAIFLIVGGLIAFFLARPIMNCPPSWNAVLGKDATFCAKDGETGYVPERGK